MTNKRGELETVSQSEARTQDTQLPGSVTGFCREAVFTEYMVKVIFLQVWYDIKQVQSKRSLIRGPEFKAK